MTREELKALFDPIQHAELECDGFSQIVASILIESGFSPALMAGHLTLRGQTVRPHLWVEIDGWIIDYQVKRWLGDHPWVPHGVFDSSETDAVYSGEQIRPKMIPAGVRALMLMSTQDLTAHAAISI